jgi:ribosome biogenesis GTPase A
MEPYWNSIKQIIRESDIILEILDARAVSISRNAQLEELIKNFNRPRIFVINKVDLINKKDLELAVETLAKENENAAIVYVSNRNKKSAKNLLAKIRQVFAKYGKRQDFYKSPIIARPYREAKGDIVVGVVGYPNVGKSTIINAVSFTSKAKVSSKSGTTHGVHWISAGKDIKLIDTPGVIPLSYVNEADLGFIAAKSPERLKDPEGVAGKIIEQFIKQNKIEKLESFYSFKVSEDEKENPYLILEKLAKAKGHLKKGGVADETRTSIMLVKDWQDGKLKL